MFGKYHPLLQDFFVRVKAAFSEANTEFNKTENLKYAVSRTGYVKRDPKTHKVISNVPDYVVSQTYTIMDKAREKLVSDLRKIANDLEQV